MKPHTFALEMLKWAENLPIKIPRKAPLLLSSIKASSDALVVTEPSTNEINVKEAKKLQKIYIECGVMANRQFCDFKKCESVKQATEKVKMSTAEIEEFVRLEVEKAKRRAERQKEEVSASIDQMNKSQAGKVEILNSRIEDKENDIKVAFQKLTYVEQRAALQEARADHLAALYTQKCHEVAALHNQVNNMDSGGCIIS